MKRRNFLVGGSVSLMAATGTASAANAFGWNCSPGPFLQSPNCAAQRYLVERAESIRAIESRLSEAARDFVAPHGLFPGASFDIIAKPFEYRAVIDEAVNLGTDLCMPVRIVAVYESGQRVESMRIWQTLNGHNRDIFRGAGHERYIAYDPGNGHSRLKVSAGERGHPVIVMHQVQRNMNCGMVHLRNG